VIEGVEGEVGLRADLEVGPAALVAHTHGDLVVIGAPEERHLEPVGGAVGEFS
jgi:hypothetical protein